MLTRPRHQDGLPYWAVERTQGTHLLSVSEVVTTLGAAAAPVPPSIHKVLIWILLYLSCGLSPSAARTISRGGPVRYTLPHGRALAKLHLSAESPGLGRAFSASLACAVQQAGTGGITGARNDGSSRKGNQGKHPAPPSTEAPQGRRHVAKSRRKKRKKSQEPAAERTRSGHVAPCAQFISQAPDVSRGRNRLDVSLATDSPVLTVNDDLPRQLEEARTPPIASLEGKTDGLAGMLVGVRGKRARSGVARDREHRRGGRSVGVVGGRMSSTHDRGGNEARWKRWECVLAGSGATRPADGERAGRLASVTRR
ncbi:hypothetical protein JB92DRAFT_2832994 [Gautieria morchelliformis]|nr:hypothetical protein JB92DRAFT_2832994 [Gautieria morchelliformis]